MPPRLRLFYSALTSVLLLIPALALYRELSTRSDIWWTPPTMALSLTESQERVQVYARDRSLGSLLDAKQLWIKDQAGSSPLGAQEIRLRFNNWERVRATRLPVLLLYAATCGGGIVLLLVIATGRLAYRGEREPVAA
jgi:hypothetical protein